MLRKARLVIIGAAGALLLALFAAHTPPARTLVLRRVVEAFRTSYGIHLRAESLSYNLLTFSAEFRGIQLAAVDTPAEPFAVADAVAMSVPANLDLNDKLEVVPFPPVRTSCRVHRVRCVPHGVIP
jgi:hypothetical protein